MLGSVLERATIMSCSHSSLILLLVSISTNFENPYRDMMGQQCKGSFSNVKISFHLAEPKAWKCCCTIVPKTSC